MRRVSVVLLVAISKASLMVRTFLFFAQVDSLMRRLGLEASGPDVVIQQPMGALAQLCMWQLVVGYKLRELEALERGVDIA